MTRWLILACWSPRSPLQVSNGNHQLTVACCVSVCSLLSRTVYVLRRFESTACRGERDRSTGPAVPLHIHQLAPSFQPHVVEALASSWCAAGRAITNEIRGAAGNCRRFSFNSSICYREWWARSRCVHLDLYLLCTKCNDPCRVVVWTLAARTTTTRVYLSMKSPVIHACLWRRKYAGVATTRSFVPKFWSGRVVGLLEGSKPSGCAGKGRSRN